jgi:hypothetical protein
MLDIAVDHGDVVGFGNKALGDRGTHLASTQDDDFHFCFLPSPRCHAAGIAQAVRMQPSGSAFLVASADTDAELLELAVQVGALQAGLLGQAGHVAAVDLQVVLEVQALEDLPGLPQGQIEGQAEGGGGS